MAKKRGLTARFVATVRRPGVYGDLHGLRLYVRRGGSKDWQWRGTVQGARRDLGLGGYPYVTLAEAREKAYRYRKLSREGGDPRLLRAAASVPSFAEAAERVIALHEPNWKNGGKTAAQWRSTLRDYVLPKLGGTPVDAVRPGDVLAVLQPVWNTKRETAKRVKQRIQAVMLWAVAEGHRNDDPVAAIAAALPSAGAGRGHHRALPWREAGAAVRTVRESGAWPGTKLAFEFLVLTAARSGEARGAEWGEIDPDAAVWTVPASRMKAGRAHRVPLSGAALEVLRQARALGGDRLVFPGGRGGALSDATVSKLLRENGVQAVPHGFRSTFRDWAGETGVPREVAEAALAHAVRGVEGAYARSDLLDRRRPVMEDWAGVLASGAG